MKLVFDSLDELRTFVAELDGDDGDTKPKRTRKTKAEKEAEAAAIASNPNSNIAPPGAGAGIGAQAGTGFPGGQQGFVAPAVASAPQAGFVAPGAAPVAPQLHPIAAQMIAITEKAVAAGQPQEQAIGWWRQFLGPDAAQSTWEQMKAVNIPQVPETALKQVCGQFGITA